MQHLKNGLFKSFISIFLAFMILVMSLCDSFGQYTMMPPQKTEAVALVDDAAALYGILSLACTAAGITISKNLDVNDLIHDMKACGNIFSEGWQDIFDSFSDSSTESKLTSVTITKEMVADISSYISSKNLTWEGNTCSFTIGQNASQWLMEMNPAAYLAVISAGYGDQLASMERFYVDASTISGSIAIMEFPQEYSGIILGNTAASINYITSAGKVISPSRETGLGIPYMSVTKGTDGTYKSSSYYTGVDWSNFGYCFRSDVSWSFGYDSASGLSVIYNGLYGAKTRYNVYGVQVWESAESYLNGDAALASNPDYGLSSSIICMPTGADIGASIIGKTFPLDGIDYEALNESIITAGKDAYDIAIDAGMTAEEAQDAAQNAAASTADEALADINNKLGDSTSGIMGLLTSILAAVTSGGIFALLKEFFAFFTAFANQFMDGSLFASIISAIAAAPGAVVNKLAELPGDIADSIKAILTALGLADVATAVGSVMSRVLTDLGFDAIMDIPESIAGAVSDALEWIMDIPQTLADAISKGLEWIMDIPEILSDAISDALEWLRDLVITVPGLEAVLDWLLLDVEAITLALSGINTKVLDRVALPFPSNPFLPLSGDMDIVYPIISMNTPKILKSFLFNTKMAEEIVLIDFSDYEVYCQTVRALLRGVLWFSFVLYLIKSHRIEMSIS